MELLRELHRGGATICMVTHDPRYAQHADRIVHMFDGLIVEEEQGANRREIAEAKRELEQSGFGAIGMIILRNIEKAFSHGPSKTYVLRRIDMEIKAASLSRSWAVGRRQIDTFAILGSMISPGAANTF